MTGLGAAELCGRSARAPERVGRSAYVTWMRGELAPTLAAINHAIHRNEPHRDPAVLRRVLDGLRSL